MGWSLACGAMSGSNRFPKSLKIEIIFRKAVALGFDYSSMASYTTRLTEKAILSGL